MIDRFSGSAMDMGSLFWFLGQIWKLEILGGCLVLMTFRRSQVVSSQEDEKVRTFKKRETAKAKTDSIIENQQSRALKKVAR